MSPAVLAGIEDRIRLGREHRAAGRYDAAEKEFSTALSACAAAEEPYLHNTALNELEITRGTAVVESKPRSMSVVLSNKCNIECIMCSVWNNEWELPDKTLREVSELFPYLGRLMWQGGEVLMRPGFEELFDEIARYENCQQHIITNGLLFSSSWVRRLARANISLIVSVDGVTPKTYDHIRKKGRFDKLLEGLNRLNAERAAAEREGFFMSNTMNVVVMRSNYRELEGFVDFAHRHKFKILQVTPVDIPFDMPTGTFEGDPSEDIFRNPDAEALAHIASVLPKMRARAEELGLLLHVWLPPLEKPSLIREATSDIPARGPEKEISPARPNEISCHWPWQLMHIDRKRVRPHCFCGNDIGTVPEDSLMEIWNSEPMQTYRRRLHANTAAGWCANRCVARKIEPDALKLDC